MGLGGARRDGAHQGLTMSTIALRAVLPECQPDDDGRDTTVSLHRISKHFGHLRAIDDVCLSVRSGEIHALLGENGAGKSTLMNILSGTYQPDAGEIRVDNIPIRFGSPAAAIAAGIGMVHQHFKLVDAFTVAENLHIGWVEGPWWRSQRTLVERTRMLAEQMNLTVDPEACMGDLSAGEQQRVDLQRARGRRGPVVQRGLNLAPAHCGGDGLAELGLGDAKLFREPATDFEKAVIDRLHLPRERSPRELTPAPSKAGHATNHRVFKPKSAIIGE